jgi:hypothetical protein
VVSYAALDRQLARYSRQLEVAVGLSDAAAGKVATLVASEVRFLDQQRRSQVLAASPVHLASRLEELRGFQAWTEIAAQSAPYPAVARTQVVAQNYICFVYLGEACFKVLRSISLPGSVTRRCCKYLTDNPVRAFRNAIAHANWEYGEGFRSLVYWARKGADRNEPLSRFEVAQAELDFWQALSRGVAYAAYTELESVASDETG